MLHPACIYIGIAPTWVQDLALGPVELNEVGMGTPLKPVQVPLDGTPYLWYTNCTTQLGVICKVAEGVLDSTVHVTYKDVNKTSPNTDPRGITVVISLHLDTEQLTATF